MPADQTPSSGQDGILWDGSMIPVSAPLDYIPCAGEIGIKAGGIFLPLEPPIHPPYSYDFPLVPMIKTAIPVDQSDAWIEQVDLRVATPCVKPYDWGLVAADRTLILDTVPDASASAGEKALPGYVANPGLTLASKTQVDFPAGDYTDSTGIAFLWTATTPASLIPPTVTAGSFIIGNKYKVVTNGNTDYAALGASPGGYVSANRGDDYGGVIAGLWYKITYVGTTNWVTDFGASANTVGVFFQSTHTGGTGHGDGEASKQANVGTEWITTGIGSGTGTAQELTINATQCVAGKRYLIGTIGTTNWTAIGAASNTVGLEFIATGAGTGTGYVTLAPAIPHPDLRAGQTQYPGIQGSAIGTAYTGTPFLPDPLENVALAVRAYRYGMLLSAVGTYTVRVKIGRAKATWSKAAKTLTLAATQTSGATIKYSVDGSTPTLNYSAPLSITDTTTVRWYATKTNMVDSDEWQTIVTFTPADPVEDPPIAPDDFETVYFSTLPAVSTTVNVALQFQRKPDWYVSPTGTGSGLIPSSPSKLSTIFGSSSGVGTYISFVWVKDTRTLTLSNPDGYPIYYKLGTGAYQLYSAPITTISVTTTITAYVVVLGGNSTTTTDYVSYAAYKYVAATDLVAATDYRVGGIGGSNWTLLGAPNNTIGTKFYGYFETRPPSSDGTAYSLSWSVGAYEIVAGTKYMIDYPGTVDYTLIGAANNNAGTIFTATGTPAEGWGYVYVLDTIVNYDDVDGSGWTEYVIASLGTTTDFTLVGAANNNYFTLFTATGPATGPGYCYQPGDFPANDFTHNYPVTISCSVRGPRSIKVDRSVSWNMQLTKSGSTTDTLIKYSQDGATFTTYTAEFKPAIPGRVWIKLTNTSGQDASVTFCQPWFRGYGTGVQINSVWNATTKTLTLTYEPTPLTTADVKLYYSLDGSTPSVLYVDPISISGTVTPKFMAVHPADAGNRHDFASATGIHTGTTIIAASTADYDEDHAVTWEESAYLAANTWTQGGDLIWACAGTYDPLTTTELVTLRGGYSTDFTRRDIRNLKSYIYATSIGAGGLGGSESLDGFSLVLRGTGLNNFATGNFWCCECVSTESVASDVQIYGNWYWGTVDIDITPTVSSCSLSVGGNSSNSSIKLHLVTPDGADATDTTTAESAIVAVGCGSVTDCTVDLRVIGGNAGNGRSGTTTGAMGGSEGGDARSWGGNTWVSVGCGFMIRSTLVGYGQGGNGGTGGVDDDGGGPIYYSSGQGGYSNASTSHIQGIDSTGVLEVHGGTPGTGGYRMGGVGLGTGGDYGGIRMDATATLSVESAATPYSYEYVGNWWSRSTIEGGRMSYAFYKSKCNLDLRCGEQAPYGGAYGYRYVRGGGTAPAMFEAGDVQIYKNYPLGADPIYKDAKTGVGTGTGQDNGVWYSGAPIGGSGVNGGNGAPLAGYETPGTGGVALGRYWE